MQLLKTSINRIKPLKPPRTAVRLRQSIEVQNLLSMIKNHGTLLPQMKPQRIRIIRTGRHFISLIVRYQYPPIFIKNMQQKRNTHAPKNKLIAK